MLDDDGRVIYSLSTVYGDGLYSYDPLTDTGDETAPSVTTEWLPIHVYRFEP